MSFKLNEKGQLVDAEGKAIELDGKAIEVDLTGLHSQSEVDKVVKNRLAKSEATIKHLTEQTGKSPELERMLEAAKDEKRDLELQLTQADAKAQEKIASQMTEMKTQLAQTNEALQTERKARVVDHVSHEIVSLAGNKFLNPNADLVPRLLQTMKTEPALDAAGNQIDGQVVRRFETEIVKDGKQVLQALPLQEAIEAFSAHPDNQHYVRASERTGGGGATGNVKNISSFDQIKTDEDRSAFLKEHGIDAYTKLKVDAVNEGIAKQAAEAGRATLIPT